MAKIPFKYYLHDSGNSSERNEFIASQLSKEGTLSEEEALKLLDENRYLFYEVELNCELDTVTREVTILNAK